MPPAARCVHAPASSAPPFALREETFAYRSVHLSLLVPQSADDLIDESRFEKDEFMPYWAELWPSAIALAKHLVDHPPAPATSMLELGCGLALPSLALASIGLDVTATDWAEEGLALARVNARQNGLDDRLRFERLDWSAAPADPRRFDLIIGSDLIYERRNVEWLVNLLPHVCAAGGRFIIADPGRAALDAFCQAMMRSWSVREHAAREEPRTHSDGSITISRVRLIEFSHDASSSRR